MWEVITKYYGIDWIAMILNALSIYLLGKRLKLGFFLGVVANLAWIAFAVLADSAATVKTVGAYSSLTRLNLIVTPKRNTHGAYER